MLTVSDIGCKHAISRKVKITASCCSNFKKTYANVVWYFNALRHNCIPSIGLNPCNVFNGRCDHICTLAAENQATCSCRAGYQILEDGRTCLLGKFSIRERRFKRMDPDRGWEGGGGCKDWLYTTLFNLSQNSSAVTSCSHTLAFRPKHIV